jgi:orotidine-5'-phosphate decarboxylase
MPSKDSRAKSSYASVDHKTRGMGQTMSLDASDAGFSATESDVMCQPSAVSLDAAKGKLVVALDRPTVAEASRLVDILGSRVKIYKIGMELVFSSEGLAFAEKLQKDCNKRVFLDMKLLDIPNTVEKAVANVARMGFEFLTVHAHDSKTMLAAVRGRNHADLRPEKDRLKLLGVSVLTSCDQEDLFEQGLNEDALTLAVRRAKMACLAGFDGVIASGHEAKHIRFATKELKSDFIIKVPGIRPHGSAVGDQSRVMTPSEALRNGATYLVIGRPITEADKPELATERILEEISREI